jgi:hypothetical protein
VTVTGKLAKADLLTLRSISGWKTGWAPLPDKHPRCVDRNQAD